MNNLNQDYLYVNFYTVDKHNLGEERDDIISLIADIKNIGTISGNYYVEKDLELYEEPISNFIEELSKQNEDLPQKPPPPLPEILSESCEITFTQDSDCCQSGDGGQFLKIKTENGAVDLESDFFILETERWAFDDIDEMILLLQTFKSRYEKWKS